MKERLRIVAAACFYYSGLVKLALWWAQRTGPHLIILNYHRATGGDLRRQMLYLRKHYRCLHVEEALEELAAPPTRQRRRHDRRIPFVLTFDDGYRDNYTLAFALAQELGVPITLFLIPGYIESGKHFWWLEGQGLVRNAQVDQVTIDGRTYDLGRPDDRKAIEQAIDTSLRHARSVAEREAFLMEARKALAVPVPRLYEEEAALPLTWPEVREMEASGWVSFGAHTMHHPVLAYLEEPQEVFREVAESRRALEQQLGRPVSTFAYPIGKPEHFGEEGLQAVKAAGFRWALTTIPERNTAQTDPHLVGRQPGDVTQHWLVMASELVGLLGVLSRLRDTAQQKRFLAGRITARRRGAVTNHV